MKIRRTIPAVLAALACALSVAAQSAQTPAREPLTVMSFNIRYGTANDGENHWTLRREFLFDVDARGRTPMSSACRRRSTSQIDEIARRRCRSYARRRRRARRWPHARESTRRSCIGATASASRTPARSGSRTRRGRRVEIVGQQHHAHLHVGALRRSRRPRPSGISTCTSTTSRSRRASGARRCCAERIAARALPSRAGHRHRRFQRRRRRTPRSRASTAPLQSAPAPFVDTFRVRHPDEPRVGTFNGFKFGQTGRRQDRLRARRAGDGGADAADRPHEPERPLSVRSLSGDSPNRSPAVGRCGANRGVPRVGKPVQQREPL